MNVSRATLAKLLVGAGLTLSLTQGARAEDARPAPEPSPVASPSPVPSPSPVASPSPEASPAPALEPAPQCPKADGDSCPACGRG